MADRICENLKDRRENVDPNKVYAGCNKYVVKFSSSHTPPDQLDFLSKLIWEGGLAQPIEISSIFFFFFFLQQGYDLQ